VKSQLLALLTGAISGLVAALCGVGGGVIMVPAFRSVLQLTHKQAIATSLAVIIPTAVIATLKNASGDARLITWSIVLPAALGAAISAFFAVDLMKSLSNPFLTRLFTGLRMLFQPQ